MHLDASRVLIANAIDDIGLQLAAAVAILAHQAGHVVAFAVAVLHPVGPG